MTTHDNAPPLDGFEVTPRCCCGLWQTGLECKVCLVTLPMPDCVLGEN